MTTYRPATTREVEAALQRAFLAGEFKISSAGVLRDGVPERPITPNTLRVQRVQELRRSNATTPRPSGKRYKRKAKHPKRGPA